MGPIDAVPHARAPAYLPSPCRPRVAPIPITAELLLTGTLRAQLPGLVASMFVLVAVFWPGGVDLQAISDAYALLLYAVGLGLAAFFHRSRVVIALLGLGLLDWGIGPGSEGLSGLTTLGTAMWGLLGLLALMRDRGVLSRGGLVQLGVAGAVGILGFLSFRDPERVAAWLGAHPPLGGPLVMGLPLLTIIVGSAAVLFATYGVYRWQGPVDRALAWSQLGLFLAMLPAVPVGPSGMLLMGCGLALTLSVIEQSYSMAYKDELTGLPGRRALMKDLADIGGTYSVAMVDVDHFKGFNDKYGHDVGDQVLKLVASKLRAGRGGGKAYRYGGEEFTLLYPGRARDDALPHVEAVREKVEATAFTLRRWNRPRKKPDKSANDKTKKKKTKKAKRPRHLSVTVSAGLADSRGKASTPEGVLKKADEALYRAKGDGRNRVAT